MKVKHIANAGEFTYATDTDDNLYILKGTTATKVNEEQKDMIKEIERIKTLFADEGFSEEEQQAVYDHMKAIVDIMRKHKDRA